MSYEQNYKDTLELHLECIKKAGEQLELPWYLIKSHDKSKWTVWEFEPYARWHKGPKDNPIGYAKAWLHHIHHNMHHWQHWIFPDNYTLGTENGVVRMPKTYALEMVADWMAASKAYTGSWDMSEWLKTNVPKITVHSETSDYLMEVLHDLGYSDFGMFRIR